jgi:hypothetical protein
MPGDSHEHAPIGDGWSNDVERQFYVLSRFFGERNVLLPEPYAVELAGFVDLIAVKEFATSAKTYLRTRREVLKTLETSETKEILERMKRTEAEPLTDDELDRYFNYFEKHTPNLVAFARGLDLTPFGRLKDLLLQRTFKALEREYPDAVSHVDEERAKRRFALLSKLRSQGNPASNVIDARALGEVEAANELLVPARKRILLVSRSAHLMAVAEAEARDREVFVRHPRTVSTAYLDSPSGVSLADEAELQIRHQSLLAFISGAEEAQIKLRGIDGTTTEHADVLNLIDGSTGKTLRQLLERIQSEWRNVEAYATGLTKAGETRKRKGSRKEVAIDLLALLRDPSKLRSRMVDHIQQIFREVRRDRDRVAFRLQRDRHSHGGIDYPIEFQDSDLRTATAKLSAAWSSNLADAETLFEVAIRCENDYDCLLGIAVSLGALGRWHLARQYVDYGLVSRPPGQRREGLFLQGVMAKRMSFEKQSLGEAEERMQDALESVEAAIREHGGQDPRYLNERARLKLWLIEFARSPEGAPRSEQNETPFALADVITDLNEAVVLASGKLKIQILNSLCYAHLLSEDFEGLPTALDHLRSALTNTYPDRSKWPPFALDTVVYTMYRLQRSQATLGTLKSWSQELATVLEQADVSSQERRLIGAHASEIAEYLPTEPAS